MSGGAERLPSDDEILLMAGMFFGVSVSETSGCNQPEVQNVNHDLRRNGWRRRVVDGRKFLALDLGAKGYKGVFESAPISSKSVVGRELGKKSKRS